MSYMLYSLTFSKSVWMTPAACGAVMPLRMVQARVSLSPGGGEGTPEGHLH